MASMVAKACSSTSSQMPAMAIQEKGSRNKRKFRADPPLVDPNKIIPLPSNECTSFEFSAEKFDIIRNHGHTNACDMCCVNQDTSDTLKLDLGLSCTVGALEVGPSRPREEIQAPPNEFLDADWSDLTESQLEELVLSNLDAIFKSAINKIVASGSSEEVATRAILRSGLWYGCKDTVSNIVESTLAYLISGQEIGPSREHNFEDLQQMEKYVLAEMVCLLREVRPFFSTGDAMWCLLICDMDVSHACAMDADPLGSFLGDDTSNENNTSISSQPQLRPEPKSSESNVKAPCNKNTSVAYPHSSTSEPSCLASVHGQYEAPKATNIPNVKPKSLFLAKECQNPISNVTEKPFSATGVSHNTVAEEKFVASRRVSGIGRRESILRQKSIHFEKHYRSYGSKGSRGGKLSSFSGLVLDKKLKAVADSTGINAKNGSFKIGKADVSDVSQDNVNQILSTDNGFNSVPTFGSEANNGNSSVPKSNISASSSLVPVNTSPSLPVADTELSLSFPAKGLAHPMPLRYNIDPSSYSYPNPSNGRRGYGGQWYPHDRKDEMIVRLVPRVKELQNQLQEWTEWANQKVMQAARRLSKDKAELKTLRQEKEEMDRLKKEKQALEENTMKKLSEMENALCKAGGQVERANAAVRRREVENAVLRREMEAAKLHAVETAASCQEVSKREKKTMMKFQSEKQKTILQEELAAEKHKLTQLQQDFQLANEIKDQAEAKLNQEVKANNELLTQASSFKKERDQIEASTKSKEDTIKLRAENNLIKYKDDIEKLEKEISQLRLKTDSSKIAALRRGIDGTYVSKVTNFRNTPPLLMSKMAGSTNLQDFTGSEGNVKRERECVMCLSEEMSVVFLPCAHQVVCTMCNELHEKQGMKDCPSCRSPIQRRVCVRFARS